MTLTTLASELDLQHALLSPGKGGTYTWRVADDVVHADAYVANLFGIAIEDAMSGLPLVRFLNAIHPEDVERVSSAIGRAIESGVAYRAEYRVIDASGRVAHVLAMGQCFHGKNDQPEEYAGMIFELGASHMADHSEHDMVERCIAAFKAAKNAGNEMITYLLSMALIEIGEKAARQLENEGTGSAIVVNRKTH